MRRFLSPLVVVIAALGCITSASGQVLNDPLNGSTIGTRAGGTFTGGGWRVDNQYDSIYWHTGNFNKGSFEYNVRGLPGNTCPGGAGFKSEVSHMYDFTWNNSDNQYAPGYQNSPHKQYLRKQCNDPGKENRMEILWQILPNFGEDDSPIMSWDVNATYLFKNEWENTGGNAIMKTFRNGGLIKTQVVPGSWSPGGQSVRIAASTRRADEGATTGSIYSNVKVYNLSSYTPAAPSVTVPSSGSTVNTPVSYIQWNGDPHIQYQVRINTSNDPNTGTVWDSQQVSSQRSFTWTGTLGNGTYFVFVRLASASAQGGWSANGHSFTVNTSFVPGGINYVTVQGNSYRNNSGPFLGLGFSHFRALQRCKFDRPRYQSDLAVMSARKFGYQRLLSMVAWDDLEIAPVTFTNPVGQNVPAWPDYWQQFRDAIDIAFDTYGIRSQITIFADAQFCMPSDSTRNTHITNILSNIAGREHKIVLIEMANEHFQNGFPDPNGTSDMAFKAGSIASQTPIPVALSSGGSSNDEIACLHSGPTADVVVQHFERDTGTNEGGWLPVRDSYRDIGLMPPMSSNEPIGPGSSVSSENDPIKLCMAGVFAWTANCVSYVYHAKAGIQGWTGCCPPSGTEQFFVSQAGVDSYQFILPLLPKELSSWERNDGKAGPSPFTNYSMGQANKWWTEVGGSTNGCVRNISAIKSGRFVTCPIGILGGGLEIEARRPMQFKAYNPLTGAIAYTQTLATGNHFTLAQGTGAYAIVGDFTDVPIDPGGGGGGGTSTQVTIDLGTTDVANGLTHPQPADGDTVAANIGGRDCKKNVTAGADNYFYFAVSDGYAFQGNKPNHWFRFDYYDTGTGTATLEYDSATAAYTNGGTITYTNSNTWKTALFNVSNAYFGNRQNNGADFRLSRNVTFYLDTVYVFIKAFSGTAIVLPATVQAEDFNNGGPGQGYNDSDATNNGGQYRLTEQVDVETTGDTGGGFNVGFTANGEWLQYQVNVVTAGAHDIKVRVASPNTGGTFHIDMNGVNVTGTRTVPNTGGWQIYTTVNIPGITLNTGVQTLRFTIDIAGYNFNYITIEKAQSPFGGTARPVPGIVQAEDFDDGGQGVAYNDTDIPNNGGAYRTGERVDIEPTADTGGGFNVGFIETGEWLEYTVNVAQAGDYTIKMRVTSCCANAYWHFEVDGAVRTAGRGMATTGGWQNWVTVNFTGIFLPAGIHIFRVTADSGGFNFNSMEFVFAGADVVSVDLDETNVNDGMTAPLGGDGDTAHDQIGGHLCRKNMDPAFNDRYFYFTVSDAYAFQGSKNSATITVDYYDSGTQTLVLEYDSTSAAYTAGGNIVLGNTNTWKTATLNIGSVYFGNRQNNASDFRIYTGGNFTVRLDTVTVFATTGGPVTLNNSAFPSNADGWNVVVWRSGPYVDGTMVWQSANGNPTGNMLSNGSGGSDNTDSCTREGGEINKAVSTAGYNTLVQVVYDVRFETNQTGPTCTGGCAVLEGTCADKLAVYYSTAGTGGPWTLLEAVNASSVTQNVWSTRTINCPAAANNKPNFATRFRWQFNQVSDGGRLDNVKVIATP